MDSYTETKEGLRFEIGFTNRDYIVQWLLGFGDKVKVIEPAYIANDLVSVAKKIISNNK